MISRQEQKLSVNVLQRVGVPVYLHYAIEGYPNDVKKIISEQGFGINDYIETTKPLVVVTAPGPGSGKMATCCLSYTMNTNAVFKLDMLNRDLSNLESSFKTSCKSCL